MAKIREELILAADNSDLVKGTKEAQSAVDALGKEAKETGAEAGAAFEKVGDGAKKAADGTDTLDKSLKSVAIGIKTMLAGEALGLATQALGTLKAKIEETLQTGIAYNRMLQDSKAGLGALILANYELRDSHGEVLTGQAKLTEAFKQAGDLQKKLAEDAQKTSAEYEDLVQAFQAGLAPAIQAGVKDMDQLRAIMLAASQAAKVLGVEGNQLSQEMNALFRFEKGPDNKLANALQLTSEKLKELKASGQDVGAFLLEQLKPYSDAAAASMDNFSVATSNLNAAIKEAAGELTKPLFDVLSKSAADAQGRVKDVTAQLKGTGEDLATIGKNVEPVVTSVVKLGAALTALGTSAGAALSPVAGYFVAITNAFTDLANKLGPGGMELIGRVIATQFGVIVRESEKAGDAIEKVGMAASHLPAPLEKMGMAASHAAGTIESIGTAAVTGGKDLDGYGIHIENIGKDADETRRRLEALDIQMGKTGNKPGGPSQMEGTLWQNIDAANQEQEAIGRLMEKRTQAHELLMRQMDEQARRNREAHEEHMRRLENAQAEVDAAQRLQQIEEGTIKFKGQVRILNMELTRATEAQTKALYDQIAAFEKLSAVQEDHNRLIDYAAHILDSYRSGYTDLITSMNAAGQTLQQLREILMHNMGTPFEATIREWIAAFEDLYKTLATGGKGPAPIKLY